MIIFLIVLVTILVVCCCVMLCLYFSVRQEADCLSNDYDTIRDLYNKSQKHALELGSEKDNLEGILEQVKRDYRRRTHELYDEIDLLRQQVDDRTINYVTTTVAADDVNSNIVIPKEIIKNGDPVESSLFYRSAWNMLVNLVAKDILGDSTTFHIEYDILSDTYRLCFHYKKFRSERHKSDWYHINLQSESPVEELINRIRKQEGENK